MTEELTRLEAYKKNIYDLSGIEHCTNLQKLYLDGNQIIDLSPLSKLNLVGLELSGNRITDLSPLSNISTLALLRNIGKSYGGLMALIEENEIPIHLGLSNNQISDIGSLVNNSGIGEGHAIDLRGNPLNDEAYSVHIPILQKRGVKVLFDTKP